MVAVTAKAREANVPRAITIVSKSSMRFLLGHRDEFSRQHRRAVGDFLAVVRVIEYPGVPRMAVGARRDQLVSS